MKIYKTERISSKKIKGSLWWKLAIAVLVPTGIWIYRRLAQKKEKLALEAAQQKFLEEWQENMAQEDEESETLSLIEGVKEIQYPETSCIYVDIVSEELKSTYLALLDVEENEITAGKNAEEKIYPADMTMVMTLLTAVEEILDINQTLEITEEFVSSDVQWENMKTEFELGDIVFLKDLMYSMILHSDLAAARVLVKITAGSEIKFVEKMNQKCEELKLKHTHFTNVTGMFDENQYTTPADMAFILKAAMENSICAEILSTYQYTTAPVKSAPEGILFTNTIFTRMYGTEVEDVAVIAGKTAYDKQDGYSLVSYATKDGRAYIAVAAGAEDKWHVIFDHFALYRDYLPAFMPSQKFRKLVS